MAVFSKSIHKTYRKTLSIDKKGNIEQTNAYKSYGCCQFFSRKIRFASYLKICAKMLRVIYKFENQSLVTCENNLKFIGDLSFSVYFDFETATGSSLKVSLDNREM